LIWPESLTTNFWKTVFTGDMRALAGRWKEERESATSWFIEFFNIWLP